MPILVTVLVVPKAGTNLVMVQDGGTAISRPHRVPSFDGTHLSLTINI